MKMLLKGGPHDGRKIDVGEDVHSFISAAAEQQSHELWDGEPERVLEYVSAEADGRPRYTWKRTTLHAPAKSKGEGGI